MKGFTKSIAIYALVFAFIIIIVTTLVKPASSVEEISYSDLAVKLTSDEIATIKFVENDITGTYVDGTKFHSYIPSIVIFTSNFYDDYVAERILSGKIKFEGEPVKQTPVWLQVLPTIGMIVVIGLFWFFFMQQSQGGNSKAMSFGKSRAKVNKPDDPSKTIKFSDVAGLKEEKEELTEVVDFLKNPNKYTQLGARIPKGVLMVGPPGTGKTYLSRAVAGEAGVPFFSISGSDFVEMFVGVGASRVRDLFEQAKKSAPCIIFIDEIDAVGRKRGAGLGGGNDEREQTLNQLLVEMDGFGQNEGIIMMAATNRPDILDPALLRPGRFDRQIRVGVPDLKARLEILRIHARNKPIEEDVNFESLARRISGFTPADIENLMNEGALLSARANKTTISNKILEEAITKVIAGPEKKSKLVSDHEKKITAYHEAGHAVVARISSKLDPVHLITIVPRGGAGGFTWYLPEEDRNYHTKSEMNNILIRLLGGRVAEKIIFGDITTGASNDIQRATNIAREMIVTYGMSDNLGPINYGSDQDEVFLGRDYSKVKNYSEEVASKIDKEMKTIIETAYEKAEEILTEHKDKLELIAQILLKKETIDGKIFEDCMSGVITSVDEVPDEIESSEENNNDDAENTISSEETSVVTAEENIEETEKLESSLSNVEEDARNSIDNESSDENINKVEEK